MKAQTFKVKIEGDRKITPAELLELLQAHLPMAGTSLSVINWDTKEAEGVFSLE